MEHQDWPLDGVLYDRSLALADIGEQIYIKKNPCRCLQPPTLSYEQSQGITANGRPIPPLTLQLSSWLSIGRDGGPLADVVIMMMAAVALLLVRASPRGLRCCVSGPPSSSDLCHLPRGGACQVRKAPGRDRGGPGRPHARPCEQGYIWLSSSTPGV